MAKTGSKEIGRRSESILRGGFVLGTGINCVISISSRSYAQYHDCFCTLLFLGKSVKITCHHSCSFRLEYAPNRLSVGTLPRPHRGNLQATALPRPLAVSRGGPPGREAKVNEGSRERRGRRGREKRREVKGRGHAPQSHKRYRLFICTNMK